MEFSCKGCGNRYPGCHASCETYIKEKAEWEEIKAKIAQDKAISGGLAEQRYKAVHKAQRHKINRRSIG